VACWLSWITARPVEHWSDMANAAGRIRSADPMRLSAPRARTGPRRMAQPACGGRGPNLQNSFSDQRPPFSAVKGRAVHTLVAPKAMLRRIPVGFHLRRWREAASAGCSPPRS
jgi:hypothetical protein